MLRALLASIAALEPIEPRTSVQLVIVENEVGGIAREVVRELLPQLPYPVRLEVEPVRNIARARNRGVHLARDLGANLIAFVDDDEVVERHWLRNLVAAQEANDADVVAGSVGVRLPARTSAWMRRTGLFGSRGPRQGSRLTVASTNNVLVKASALASLPGPFDEAFGISGGSDSLLFTRLHRTGAKFAWAADAVVTEEIPESRATASWVLQRAFRVGHIALRAELALQSVRLGQPLTRFFYSVGHLCLGAAMLLAALVRGRAAILRAMWHVCYGAGVLAALAGLPYDEYQSIHGE